jgi:hypothetical protein
LMEIRKQESLKKLKNNNNHELRTKIKSRIQRKSCKNSY